MEKLVGMVVYLQYFIFPFCIFVIAYIAYSFYSILVKGRISKMTLPFIVKNELRLCLSNGTRFAAAVAAGEISKDTHINFAFVLDTNKMAEDYSRYIGSPTNVCEIGKIFDGGNNAQNDAI